MADEILPRIAEKHYPAFRDMIKQDFPDAYDEWPDEYEGWRKINEEKAKKLRLLSHDVGFVDVSPDVFAKSLRETGREGTLDDLWRCARDIAGEADEAARANTEYHEG